MSIPNLCSAVVDRNRDGTVWQRNWWAIHCVPESNALNLECKHNAALVRDTSVLPVVSETSGTLTPMCSRSSRSLRFVALVDRSRPFCFLNAWVSPHSWPTTMTLALRSPSQRVHGPMCSLSHLQSFGLDGLRKSRVTQRVQPFQAATRLSYRRRFERSIRWGSPNYSSTPRTTATAIRRSALGRPTPLNAGQVEQDQGPTRISLTGYQLPTYRLPPNSSNSPTVRPVTGSTQSAAISASGSSTNRRSRKRGCGTVRSGSSMI